MLYQQNLATFMQNNRRKFQQLGVSVHAKNLSCRASFGVEKYHTNIEFLTSLFEDEEKQKWFILSFFTAHQTFIIKITQIS